MKTRVKIVIVAVIVVAAIVFGKDVLAGMLVSAGVKAVTGLQMHIGGLHVGVGQTDVGVKNLRVMNPPGFHDPVMLSMPELYVDYELGSILKGRPHLTAVRLHLAELVVVKNERGELNLNAVRAIQESRAQAEKPKAQPTAPAKKGPPLRVDLVELTVDRAVYKDYSRGGTPVVTEFPLNIKERLEHIDNPYALATLVITRALAKTTIAKLANFDLNALQAGVTQLLQDQAGLLRSTLTDATKTAEDLTRDVGGTAKQAVSETGRLLKQFVPLDQGQKGNQ